MESTIKDKINTTEVQHTKSKKKKKKAKTKQAIK